MRMETARVYTELVWLHNLDSQSVYWTAVVAQWQLTAWNSLWSYIINVPTNFV